MDNATVKDFLNELKENDTKVLNYNDFLDELKNTKEMTFTGSLKTNMLTSKDGLIPVDTFLGNLIRYEGQGYFPKCRVHKGRLSDGSEKRSRQQDDHQRQSRRDLRRTQKVRTGLGRQS